MRRRGLPPPPPLPGLERGRGSNYNRGRFGHKCEQTNSHLFSGGGREKREWFSCRHCHGIASARQCSSSDGCRLRQRMPGSGSPSGRSPVKWASALFRAKLFGRTGPGRATPFPLGPSAWIPASAAHLRVVVSVTGWPGKSAFRGSPPPSPTEPKLTTTLLASPRQDASSVAVASKAGARTTLHRQLATLLLRLGTAETTFAVCANPRARWWPATLIFQS